MSSDILPSTEQRTEFNSPTSVDQTATNNRPKHPLEVPIKQLDGNDFKRMVWAGYAWLERHREIVNALNVFPVPDGDTGTNMYLTMRAAWHEIRTSDDADIGRIAQAVAQGALMGARGNSGVILSQILRGLAHAFQRKSAITAPDLVAGLHRASDTAYKGVVKPVEGTILTVIREASSAAQRAADLDGDLRFVLERTVQVAKETVERTPSLLPVLARAGVVDSGGKGLFYILEGMLRFLQGEQVELALDSQAGVTAAVVELDPHNLPPIRFGFDVQFLIWGQNLDVEAIRQRVIEMGDCPLVEGSSNLVKVHVHVFDPSKPLAYGLSQGFITDVVVENMDAAAAVGSAPDDIKDQLSWAPPPIEMRELIDGIGTIAVVPGPGLRAVFESLGVSAVVSGGQTMNPSTKDLLQAIEALDTEEIILLPNNSNVILAAQQARQLTDKRVEVIPSHTAPQGISALLALNLQSSLEDNVAAMRQALPNIDTGEVTVAVRNAHIGDIEVQAGDVIGLLNNELTAKSETPEEAVLTLLSQMNAHEAEIITVYYGDQVSADVAHQLGRKVSTIYPDQETEVISGGQPYYHYIISAE